MMRMKPTASIPVSKSLWGDPDDFSKFIDCIVFQWYHLNTIQSIDCFLSKAIYIFLQLYFVCQQSLLPHRSMAAKGEDLDAEKGDRHAEDGGVQVARERRQAEQIVADEDDGVLDDVIRHVREEELT